MALGTVNVGAVDGGVADNYVWSQNLDSEHIVTASDTEAVYAASKTTTFATNTYRIADGVEIVDGAPSLVSPVEKYISYGTADGGTNYDGKYCSIEGVEGIFLIESQIVKVEGSNYFSGINGHRVTVEGGIHVVGYVDDPDADAYPPAVDDGYIYILLGKLGELLTAGGGAPEKHASQHGAEGSDPITPGLIGAVAILSYYDDIDALIADGFYRVGTNTNLPDYLWYSQVFVSRGKDSDTVAQVAVAYNTGKLYSRGGTIADGVVTWSEWNSYYGGEPKTYNVTFPASGWAADSSGYQAQTVNVSGLKASYDVAPRHDVVLSGTDPDGDAATLEGFACITIVETGAGTITARCAGDAPTVAVPIRMVVWE